MCPALQSMKNVKGELRYPDESNYEQFGKEFTYRTVMQVPAEIVMNVALSAF